MQPGESPTAQTMKRFDQDGGSLSAASLMGTLLQGVDGIVLSCDPVAEQLLGYSARQLVGTTAFEQTDRARGTNSSDRCANSAYRR